MYGPPAPVPPKRNTRLWWIIGGISGALVLCRIIGTAALAANGGGNGRSTTSNGPTETGTVTDGVSSNSFGRPDNPESRVFNINTTPQVGYSPNWTRAQEQAIANQFLPPDAKLQSASPNDFPAGIVEVYTSVLLSRTMPKADFVDANGKQAQPGTFYVYFDAQPNSTYQNVEVSTNEQWASGTEGV
jgi:hypothetical protein